MSRRLPSILLALSAATLVALGVIWIAGNGKEARADLSGSPVTTVPTTTTVPPPEVVPPPGVPTRIAIPALGVDDEIIPVALQDDGAMEVPPAELAGWYRHGTTPGSDRGSAVIAAHVDYQDRPGVFIDLARLEVGAEITVVDDSGAGHTYRVIERWQVDKGALPVGELFRHDGSHVLTLITCGGAFDRSARSYADNIVVRAVPI